MHQQSANMILPSAQAITMGKVRNKIKCGASHITFYPSHTALNRFLVALPVILGTQWQYEKMILAKQKLTMSKEEGENVKPLVTMLSVTHWYKRDSLMRCQPTYWIHTKEQKAKKRGWHVRCVSQHSDEYTSRPRRIPLYVFSESLGCTQTIRTKKINKINK